MPQDRQWPQSDAEQTEFIPVVSGRLDDASGAGGVHGTDDTAGVTDELRVPPPQAEQTQFIERPQAQSPHPQGAMAPPQPPVPPQQPPDPAPADGPSKKWYRRRGTLIAGAALGALVLIYGVDLLVSQGSVPRGVTVAGVDVGGMSEQEAEQKLRDEIEPRLTQPVQYAAGDVQASLDPKAAGLSLDWGATLEQAGDQPLNPVTRFLSFFSTEEIGVVTSAEPNQLETAMGDLQEKIDHEPVEGTIKFEGATPVPVEPKQGQQLVVEAAKQAVLAHWASGDQLELPVDITPVQTSADAVRVALEQVAKPAVSGPVLVRGDGEDGTLEPEEIAAGLSFEPGDGGTLTPKINQEKIVEGVGPELESTEQEGKDAEIVFTGGKPTVEPSQHGRGIKWDKTLAPLLDVLKRTDSREIVAQYEDKPAKITTEEAEKLGIKEVIGEFTTTGFASDSGVNIKVVAQEVNGAIVKPGDTFSLNGHTGPRGKPQGYVEAGIIENGQPGRAVGGGISQFATTLYNAYYFAGMRDVAHREHSYYISRYPAGREATVFQNPDGSSVIDLSFKNDSKTGVAIQTVWTPSSITVKLWGTKRYDVESVTGDRTNFVQPGTEHVSADNCQPSGGAVGFSVTDTRILRDASSGQVVRKEPRTVKYDARDKIVCDKGD
ncbi:VanW family protein [Amycolatopsis cihanbeyliensis]|uniref:Vancomycin resistance protein YoaR n=1 Tax=Amycolatopsis cihanbeyliensis TaxID=1128664 RepID=A0A542CUE2_AMYCI|nr:VanW family protein [Amycolatopsis cihanbeyliensis]TQI94431.1 vancomycin resistance protein YoaR [Amycolatopsis cihanbeyliensis]